MPPILILVGLVSAVFIHHATQWAIGRILGIRIRRLAVLPSAGSIRIGRDASTLLSGSIANVITAMVMCFGVACWGGFTSAYFAVDETLPGGPSDGKLMPRDTIVAIDGKQMRFDRPTALQDAVQRGGERIVVTVERDGNRVDATLVPVVEDGKRRIGVKLAARRKREPASFSRAVAYGLATPFAKTWDGVKSLWRDESDDALGPVGITRMIRADSRTWIVIVEMMVPWHVVVAFLYLFIDAVRLHRWTRARRRPFGVSQV